MAEETTPEATPKEPSFQEGICAAYDKWIAETESTLASRREMREALGMYLYQSHPDKLMFRVVVKSRWESDGEKGYNAVVEGTLSSVLRRGVEQVRADGQCDVTSVAIVLPNRSGAGFPMELTVPKELWEKELPVFKK